MSSPKGPTVNGNAAHAHLPPPPTVNSEDHPRAGEPERPPLNTRKIYIGNLPDSTRNEDLQDCFGRLGEVLNIELKLGYGFVEFAEPQSAEDAISKYHEGQFLGNQIKVQLIHGQGWKTRTESSCYKCGERGHWARDCPHSLYRRDDRMARPSDRSMRDYPPPRAYDDRPRYNGPPRDSPRDYDSRGPPRDLRPPPRGYEDYSRRDYPTYPPAPISTPPYPSYPPPGPMPEYYGLRDTQPAYPTPRPYEPPPATLPPIPSYDRLNDPYRRDTPAPRRDDRDSYGASGRYNSAGPPPRERSPPRRRRSASPGRRPYVPETPVYGYAPPPGPYQDAYDRRR